MQDFAANAWFLTGPTAAGKTAVGVNLAQQIQAEIISFDSMALYRGMDIGTAKPTVAERNCVPHHLIDLLDPSQEFSVAQYLQAAERVAAEITSRGNQVLFVGGTALYLKALLRGLFSGPPANWQLRRELEETVRHNGSESLHRRLREVDPAAAAKLHPNDVRRIIRALEVQHTTGQQISEMQQQFDRGRPAKDLHVFVLDWPREQLEARIRQRVDEMFAAGLVDEVVRIQKVEGGRRKAEAQRQVGSGTDSSELCGESGNALSRTASQAVGYREVLEYLRGERELAATVELVKLRTRQFAKRQLTWFRSLSECRWVSVGEPFDPAEVARQITAP